MRNQNDLNLYKIKKESPRTQKIRQLIKKLINKEDDFHNLEGIAFRKGLEVIINKSRTLRKNIDDIVLEIN